MKTYVLVFVNGYKMPIMETTSETTRAFRRRVRFEWLRDADIADVIFK